MIKPVSFFTKSSINLIPKKKNLSSNMLPLVTVPLIAYLTPDGREKERTKKIVKEADHLAKPVTERTEYNTNQLKDSGVSEKDVKQYLTYDGHVNDKGKKILKAHNKSFKGAPENNIKQVDDNNSFAETSNSTAISDDIEGSYVSSRIGISDISRHSRQLSEQLRACGISQAEVNKYLTPSGELTDAGKEILSKNYSSNFISFTSENNLSQTTHGIDNIAGVNSELDDSELVSNISISDIGHAIGSEFVSEVETIGHTIADVPLLESVYGLSLLIKAKDPVVDLKNGRFKDAGIRTCVRAVDTFLLLPFKHGRALVGGLKGTWLSIKGIESKQTGFINGYKDELRKWVKGRRMVEEYAINPDKFDEPTSAESYEALKQVEAAAIAEWQAKVAAKSNEVGAKLNEWCERNIAYHEFMRNNFSDIISNENQRSEFYAAQLDSIIKNSDVDVQTIQKNLELMQNEQQQLEIMYNQYIENLKNSLAGLNDDNLISQKIENMSADIKKYYETRQQVLSTEIAKINNLLFINNKLQSKKSLKGMDKLAGYSDIKSNLRQIFVNPIKKLNAGINAEVPNMILLYGPKGCGKSMMANAIEEETECNVINIDISLDTENDKKTLENAILSSKDNYDNTGTHTIIRIEEIDNLLSGVKLDDSLINDFNSLAKKNHCTIIATTNHPIEINKELLPKNNLSIIYVSPANKDDIVEILKYYASDFADKTVDYDELAQQILDIAYDDAYSNAQIGGLIQKGIKMRFMQNGKLSQQDFIEILNESYPDINEEVLKSYIKKGEM